MGVTLSTWQKNFNSTMVRLKVNVNGESIEEHANFNSTMVRLKDDQYRAVLSGFGDFNSTMVRLKGG